MRGSVHVATVLVASYLAASFAAPEEMRVDVTALLPGEDPIVMRGERFGIRISPAFDACVAVLALDSRGEVRVVFPSVLQPVGTVLAGSEVSIVGITGDAGGPVLLEVIAVPVAILPSLSHGSMPDMLWNARRWGTYDAAVSALSVRRGSFSISYDPETTRERAALAELGLDGLAAAVDRDYASFAERERSFLADLDEALGDRPHATSRVDVYIADPRLLVSVDVTTEVPPDEPGGVLDDGTAIAGLERRSVGGMRARRPPGQEYPWRPYALGYWIETRRGWYWVGDDPLACFGSEVASSRGQDPGAEGLGRPSSVRASRSRGAGPSVAPPLPAAIRSEPAGSAARPAAPPAQPAVAPTRSCPGSAAGPQRRGMVEPLDRCGFRAQDVKPNS